MAPKIQPTKEKESVELSERSENKKFYYDEERKKKLDELKN